MASANNSIETKINNLSYRLRMLSDPKGLNLISDNEKLRRLQVIHENHLVLTELSGQLQKEPSHA